MARFAIYMAPCCVKKLRDFFCSKVVQKLDPLPGVDGVESQEVDDMLAGVCGEFGGEMAGLEADAGESRGPGRGVNGFGYESVFFSGDFVNSGEEG